MNDEQAIQKYVLRKIRPLSHYEEFLNLDYSKGDFYGAFSKSRKYPKIGVIKNHFLVIVYDFIPEYDSYSDEMKNAIWLSYFRAVGSEIWNRVRHTKTLCFINALIGYYRNKGILKNTNIFDLELIKEMTILQKEAWPTIN